MALKGAAGIVLGLVGISWPAITLLTLVLAFAAYCIIGVGLSEVLGVRWARYGGHWVWPTLTAVAALTAASIALLNPGPTVVAFAIMLAIWAIVTGDLHHRRGCTPPRDHGRLWMLISGGAAVLLLGLALAAVPPLDLFTLVWMIAVGMAASGFALLRIAFRLCLHNRDHRTHVDRRPKAATRPS
ncbi:HdeD family acid-resistance protein [Novosphingobium barchaimii]|uniref:HdeD family acid-resistance protein n=1 Tax=Novosphingobium barchaimii TaxID=1420591 RepID=UPI00147024F8|nr:DUF308 domain-containing protein [Novosphingobium barchaimii]